MPDKNQYEPSGWQERLDSLEEIPGEPAFHKNAAWEKLAARLDEPAKKNNRFIWWFAAAAVIAGLLLMGIRIHAPQRPQAQAVAPVNKPAVKPVIVPLPENTTTAIARKPFVVTKKIVRIITPSTDSNRHDLIAMHPKPVSIPPAEPIVDHNDTLMLATTPPQFQKKKMAVVYLNEIEAIPTDNLTKLLAPKKKFPRYKKPGQTGSENVFVATEPKRFTINLSSAN